MTPPSPLGDRMLDRAAGSPPIPGNAVRLLIDGPEAFAAMLEVIASAERWIHFENYIIRSDATGERFAEALIARARAGVRVRVLADWFGSLGTRRRFWRRLRDQGVEVRIFDPPGLVDPLSHLGRDHRKLVAADGRDVIIGGLCIGNEWSGDPARGLLPWRDTAVRIQGPAAAAIDATFRPMWELAGGTIPATDHPGEVAACGAAAVRVVNETPGDARTYRLLTAIAAGARERIWITDAYLTPPAALRTAFVDAARDGCDVQFLVPGMSDVPLVRDLTRVGYRDLLASGIRIHEWDGPMLHAKTFVADGHLARIGSTNLNYASLLGNWELDVLIDDAGLAGELERRFRLDINQSREVVRRIPAGPRIAALLPDRLERAPGAPEAVPRHAHSFRERRHRTVITLYSVAAGAGRSILLPIFLGVVLLGVAAFFLPHLVAGLTVLVALWLAQSAARQLRRGRPGPAPTPGDGPA
ncbi:MAG TPA: phospholipase D-like domain-containing protein [Gemmatimonadales bacterium]|nr:phospholipase D-like domain-containing protein [Gemmatimonadales bacterium]